MTDHSVYLTRVASVVAEVIEPNAITVDRDALYPRAALDALGRAGLLGLVSAKEVGGAGEGLRAASQVVETIGVSCASTAMVLTMHYCAAIVLEQHGPRAVREAIAAGKHITTLAFSEAGSRSHFWAPLSTAVEAAGGRIRLDADKSFSTSAGEADSYVWSSKPLHAEGASTLWLVPGKIEGLRVSARFDGLGLRGNASSALKAEGVIIDKGAMLGADGKGFDIMMGAVLPSFQILSAAAYLGIMETATRKAALHVASTKFSHLSQSIADLPTVRAFLARMRVKTDMVRALLLDTLTAIEGGREDAQLRVLEIKAAACETATEVTDLAMRVCGGAAFRKEGGVERAFRDARAGTAMSPTTDVLYDFIGKAVAGLPLF